MNEREYRAAEGWSNSQLKLLPKDPLLFYGLYISKEFPQPESTASQRLGTAIHAAVLENKPPCIIPRNALNADGHRKGKAWLDWKAEHANDNPMTEIDAEPITRMAKSIRECGPAMQLLDKSTNAEYSLFANDIETGLMLKGRLDLVSMFGEQTVLSDIKTSSETDAAEFVKAVGNYKYHRQAAFYLDLYWLATGSVAEAFCFIVVRNVPPYDCCVYELDEQAIEHGRELNRMAIDSLAARLASGDWTTELSKTIRQISLTKWQLNSED